MKKWFIFASITVPVAIGVASIYYPPILWAFTGIGPLILVGCIDLIQKKHTIRRNYPLVGHGRYLLEAIRPEIMQYFVETDTEGQPFNRIFRTLVYQRAKKVNDTTPFGTQYEVYRIGYEWMAHSLNAFQVDHEQTMPRITIGGPACSQPYSSSLLNISAMSFGSLSSNAVLALNGAAKDGNFAHNTGEGGLSDYHLQPGGDLIWQIGTGYFGCRDSQGNFSPEKFKENSATAAVKMIEIKLSQGAKPGHGGILPASKNTKEIARIRGVEPHTDIISPPVHSAFSGPQGLLDFIQQLRDLSNGKPIGFKLCVGNKAEFIAIAQAMRDSGIKPDFIAVDGGEGGTGAAPVEFSNSLGMPLRDGLSFVVDVLKGFDLKKDIRVIAAGKITAAFHLVRVLALGADLVYSARAMMLALGCIQARECNTNSCPTGIATQKKGLVKGLVVDDKRKRVTNFHRGTLHSFIELLAASGIDDPAVLKRGLINRRISHVDNETYAEIYPPVEEGSFLKKESIPEKYQSLIS